MIKYENECVGCPKEMGCLGSACPYRNVPHLYCDECEDEFDEEDLFTSNGDDMICLDCLLKMNGYKHFK